MTTIELTLALPDALAREAEAAGLLTPQAIEELLSEAVRRHRVDKLFEAADRLAALDSAPLNDAEVEAEISALRAERRAAGANRR